MSISEPSLLPVSLEKRQLVKDISSSSEASTSSSSSPTRVQLLTDVHVDVRTDVDVDVRTDVDVDVRTDVDVDIRTDVDVDERTDVDVDVRTDVDKDVRTDVAIGGNHTSLVPTERCIRRAEALRRELVKAGSLDCVTSLGRQLFCLDVLG